MRYVALLRGINVGGNHIIKMADLKAFCESLGLGTVSTFIASGNVLFDTPQKPTAKLVEALETGLSKRFNYASKILLKSQTELARAVRDAPPGFGKAPAKYRYDVAFLFGPMTGDEVVEQLNPREGVDQFWAGDGVCYFARLSARAAQSRLSKIAALPAYQQLTIRNWNTTTRLLTLMK